MNDVKFVLIKGIANFKAVHKCLLAKGHEVEVVDFNSDDILAAVKKKSSVLIAFFLDNSLLQLTRQAGSPIVAWLSDKTAAANADPEGIDHSKFHIFSLDPKDVGIFKAKGFNATLLPCNSGLDGIEMPTPEITEEDKEKYSCDVSFIGQSITFHHNPYIQFIVNFSNMNKHLDAVMNEQVENFAKNIQKDAYEKGDLEIFSIQYMHNFLDMLDRRDLDFALGVEASSRLRKKLVSALDGLNVKVFGDDAWKQLGLKTVKFLDETSYWNETPKVYKLSKINLNISKTFFTGVIQRVYDIIYCGGFCLTDYREDAAKRFEIGKEIETFSSEKEMVEKVRYYLEHDNERKEIAERGHARLMNEHRVGHRVDEVLRQISL